MAKFEVYFKDLSTYRCCVEKGGTVCPHSLAKTSLGTSAICISIINHLLIRLDLLKSVCNASLANLRCKTKNHLPEPLPCPPK